MNWHHVEALCARYIFVYRRSIFRIFDVTFYPIMELMVWGFVTKYLLQMQGVLNAPITFLIGAIIFFNILYRAQQAVTVSFLQDVWSSNLLNIFVAPVRIIEFIGATYIVGLVQAIVVAIIMFGLAGIMYSFNVASFGLTLIPLFCNLLLMGWSIGLMATALILRFGRQAETTAWAIPVLIQPFSAVFYPVSVLPHWIQPIAWMLPSTYVFEGMREVLRGGTHTFDLLMWSFILNIIYMVFSGWLFGHLFQEARNKGLISKLAW